MNTKDLKYNKEAQDLLKAGVDKLADAVKITLGPRGNNVMLQAYGVPHVTKDGVTVAKNIRLENVFEDMGCQVVKNAAARTAMDAGDGTTTATILTQSIIEHGFKALAASANHNLMRKGINEAVEAVVKALKEMAKPVTDEKQTKNVASISANNDYELGELISDTIKKIGKDGVITVEPSRTVETKITTTDGAQYKGGWLSPYFITNMRKYETEYEDCAVLCTDITITQPNQIMELIGQSHSNGVPVIIIADEIAGEALQLLITNKMKGGLKVVAVNAEGYGIVKKDIIKDIAIMTGAKMIEAEGDNKLENASIEDLGKAKKIVVGKSFTTIINGNGNEHEIKERIDQIKSLIENTNEDYEVEKLKTRLARFTGGVGVIKLGANSDVELREKIDRVDDAICATKASLEEGIVIGGGTAYVKCIKVLDKIGCATDDENMGVNVIKQALTSPLKQIALNAGDTPDMVVEKVKEKGGNIGYNAYTKEYTDMIKAGIIDPVKVTRTALENAASAAIMLLSTNCVVVDIVDEFANNNNQNDMIV